MEIPINYLAVFVATIAAYAVGALWYSVLFGERWKRLMNFTDETMKSMRMSARAAMSLGFIATLLMVYVLAHVAFMFGVNNLIGALQLGAWIWLGFQAPLLANSVLYENRPFALYVLNAAQQLVATLVAACVLVLF